MGIDGLHGVLKPYLRHGFSLRELAGQRLGVDASSWLHRQEPQLSIGCLWLAQGPSARAALRLLPAVGRCWALRLAAVVEGQARARVASCTRCEPLV